MAARIAKVWQGLARKLPIQCYLLPSGTVPAVFNADDILAAAVYQVGVAAPIFTPAVGWRTKDPVGNTQLGYDLGQIEVSIVEDESALLQPTIPYTLVVTRALAADPDQAESIVSMAIKVRSNAN
jgi:hypothetical protein